MKRRDFVKCAVAALASGAGITRLAAQASRSVALRNAGPDRPNFLYILADDLGYGDVNLDVNGLDVFRNPYIKTPQLRRLAAESIVFTDHYAAAPVCSPARVGLLTGRTPMRANVYCWIDELTDDDKHFLSGKEITIAELLRDAGYDTAVVGKWHLNGADWELKANWTGWTGSFPKQQGFNYAFVSKENTHRGRTLTLEERAHHNPGDYFTTDGDPVGVVKGWSSQIITDRAIAWLRTHRDPRKPFFLYVPYDAVHEIVESPPEFTAMYSTGDPLKDLYYANVTDLDHQIGRLLDGLREMGLDESTVVFFSSDNGPEVLRQYSGSGRSYGTAWPYRGQKRQLFEGGIREPGIVRWTGRIRPGISRVPNSAVDVLPTLCDLARIQPPRDRPLDGASLAGLLLRGEKVNRKVPLYWQIELRNQNWQVRGEGYDRRYDGQATIDVPTPSVVIRDGAYVLCGYESGEPYSTPDRFELYDIVADPMQKKDLSKAQPAVHRRMVEMLLKMHAEVNADRLRRKSEIERRIDQRQ